jgi:hypothetical protein
VLAARSATAVEPALRLYPNPATAHSLVQVRASIGAQAATLTVLNLLGQVVLTQPLPAAANGTAVLTLPNLAAGAYVVRLSTADGRALSQPLVVE